MDKEIANNLEYLSENVDYIIDILEQSKKNNTKDNTDSDSINFISNEMSSFNTYLDSMDINISSINDNITGFLENVNQDDISQEVLNDTPEILQQKQSVMDIISKIDELKSVLENINNDKIIEDDNANITNLLDSNILDNLKSEIESSISFNLDSDSIETLKSNIDNVLSKITNIKVVLDINESLDNINILKSELKTLGDVDLDLDNINLDIISNVNIDTIISKLNELNSLDLDISLDTNLDVIVENLESIKSLDLSNLENINLDSLQKNITTIDSSLNNLDNYTLDINIEDNTIESFNKIKDEIDVLSSSISESDFNANINVNPNISNIDLLRDELDSSISNIAANLDITPQIEDFTNGMEVKIVPNVDLEDIKVESKLADLETIKPEDNDDNDDFKKYFIENNKVLSELVSVLKNINTSSKNTEVVSPELMLKDDNKKDKNSIINVEAPKQETGINQIIPILQQMVLSNNMILKKLTKTSFNTDLDF